MAVSVSTYGWLLGAALVACSRAGAGNSSPEPEINVTSYGGSDLEGIPAVLVLNWHYVKTPFLVALWILVAGVLKIGRCGRRCF